MLSQKAKNFLLSPLHGACRAKMSRLNSTSSQKPLSFSLASRKPYGSPPISSLPQFLYMNEQDPLQCKNHGNHFLRTWASVPLKSQRKCWPHNSVPRKAVEMPAQCNEVATKMSRVLHWKETLALLSPNPCFPKANALFLFFSYRQKSCVTSKISQESGLKVSFQKL